MWRYVLFAWVLAAPTAQAVRQIDAPMVSPGMVPARVASAVTITARVYFDPDLIPSSVNLLEVTQDGRLIRVLSPMYDDGTHGDVVAADQYYTLRMNVMPPAAGYLWYRVTAAYRGSLVRAQSPLARLVVVGPSCTYTIDPGASIQPASGGSGTIRVYAPSGCDWAASPNVPWIVLTSGASGSGNGTVSFRVDPNPSTSPRNGTVSVADLTFTVSQAGASTAPACSVTAIPGIVRRTGLTELMPEVSISCVNVPPSGIVADVVVTLNANVTNRFFAGTSTTEALLLLNNPAVPILGVNAFQAVLGGYTSARFPALTIAPPSGDTATMRIVNLRASTDNVTGGAISGRVDLLSTAGVIVASPVVTLGSIIDPMTTSATVTPLGATVSKLTITLRETFPSAFRTRTGVSGTMDAGAEAGYQTPSLPPEIGAADTGTRLRAVFSALPGVSVYAPVYPTGSLAAQLVSADASGAGGLFLSGTHLGGTHVLLPGGAVTATWEVRTADATAIEQHSFDLVIDGATAAQAASMLQKVGLAPAINTMTSSGSAPVPRFVDYVAPVVIVEHPL